MAHWNTTIHQKVHKYIISCLNVKRVKEDVRMPSCFYIGVTILMIHDCIIWLYIIYAYQLKPYPLVILLWFEFTFDQINTILTDHKSVKEAEYN